MVSVSVGRSFLLVDPRADPGDEPTDFIPSLEMSVISGMFPERIPSIPWSAP